MTTVYNNLNADDLRRFLTPEEYREFQNSAAQVQQSRIFWPTAKQLQVLNSEADIVGYGGAAGGGKSYLGSGLAVSAHLRSAIIRPQKNQTRKFVQEITKMVGSRAGYSSLEGWTLTTPDGVDRFINFFGLDNPGDEEKQQGDDYDLKLYDECTQMRESDVRYTLTWNRSDIVGQRVRAVLAFNPPTTPEGRWVIKFFAPWLDKRHPRPAKDGELRWFATVGDNQDYEVSSSQPFILQRVDGILVPYYRFDPKEVRPEEIITPKSRTFIHAKVTDNPYYMRTGYMAQLQALPEPLRSQMLNGDFEAGKEDDAFQVIPTAWIDAAIERGRARKILLDAAQVVLPQMDSIGVDAARGGNMGSTLGSTGHDEMIIAKRYGNYIAPLVAHKGVAIDDGAKSAALVIAERRDHAPVHVDVIGVGTSVFDQLVLNFIHSIPINGSAAATGMTTGEMKLRFANLRAQLHWRMREALDPQSGQNLCLPDDQQMAADLAAPRYSLGKEGIQIESKKDIMKRLGRSPDRGDAVVYAVIQTEKLLYKATDYLDVGHGMNESYEDRRLRELES